MPETALLEKFPLFQNVPTEALEKIAALGEESALSAGEMVFKEGQKAEKLHFLLSGSIALRVGIMTKPDSVTVSFVAKPYDCFGWSGIVPPAHYTASAYCEEETRILAIPGDAFLQVMAEYPQAGFDVMRRVAELIADRLRNSRHALLKTL